MKSVELKKVFLAAMVILLVIYFAGTCTLAAQLDEVQALIAAKGKSWSAGETSISKLSAEQRKFRLGLIKEAMTGEEEVLSSEEFLTAAVPASLDWRSNGGNFVSPVRNQGSCGSCWAFSTTAALESYILIKDNLPGQNDNRAEQILVSCSGAGSCNGGYPGSAASYIVSTGLPLESYFPYTATDAACSSAGTGWQNSTYKIASWSYVCTNTTSVDLIKSALYTYGPLSTTMDVYADFFYYRSGVYEYTSGSYQGGHAILIVGYIDDPTINGGGYFIVKNSWGTGWGMSGYFNIAYSQVGYPVYFGDWTIAYHQPTGPPPAAPSGLTATPVSGSQINLSWTDNSNNESGFKIERCTGSGCTSLVQIATVGAGVSAYSNTGLAASTSYTYRVSAYNGSGNSAYSNTATAVTLTVPPPVAPSSLTATTASSSQINLRWIDNSNNETGFRIERCTGISCTNFSQIATVGAGVVTYNNTGLAANTSYTFRVSAYSASGNSASSNIAVATTLAAPQPPAAPSNLTASTVSTTQIRLSWTDNSNNENGFKIERCQGANCTNFTQITAIGANKTTYISTGLRRGTVYSYRIRSYNAVGNSVYSNVASTQTVSR